MSAYVTTTGELSLRELLTDPIVQAVMVRDGVTAADIEILFARLSARMPGRRGGVAPGHLPEALAGLRSPEWRALHHGGEHDASR